MFVLAALKYFLNLIILMMNTIMKFLRDVTNILSSVSVIRKQIAHAIAPKGALKFSCALPATISTTQFGKMAVVMDLLRHVVNQIFRI
jgi:hypothetical protein